MSETDINVCNFKQIFHDFLIHFLDHPDDFKIDEQCGNNSTVLNIYLNKGDIGRLIGLRGRNIRSLKNLAASLGNIHGKRLSVFIMD